MTFMHPPGVSLMKFLYLLLKNQFKSLQTKLVPQHFFMSSCPKSFAMIIRLGMSLRHNTASTFIQEIKIERQNRNKN